MSIERMEEPDHLHLYRYGWAARHVLPTDIVLDAACGTGYGATIIGGARYIGADKFPGHLEVDLERWTPRFAFDVFVGIETIEHLPDYSTYVATAKRARRAMVISTPIVPTCWANAFHVHDFTKQQVIDIFTDETWRLTDYEEQEKTYGLFLFERNGDSPT